jgi:peptidylprolyl isomerase
MASTTRLRDRVFAGMGAILFLVTGSALTIMVVWDTMHNKSDQTTTSSTTSSCTISTVEEAGSTLEVPEIYKPGKALTAVETTDLTVGSGAAAKAGDCLIMKYYGTLASDGTKFDENFTTTSALQFKLGASQVITGWDEGVVGMKVGGVRRIAIPYAKAYGETGQGSIPAKADLVFVVKLLKKVDQ